MTTDDEALGAAMDVLREHEPILMQMSTGGLAHREMVIARALGRALLALRQERDEAQQKWLAAPHIQCGCHPGVRWPAEGWGRQCPISAAEQRAAKAEAEAAGLRMALEEVSQKIAPRLADVVHSATRPHESPKEWLAVNLDDSLDVMKRAELALASSPLSAAVARVVEAAESLHTWEAGAPERDKQPKSMWDDSEEIEWDNRISAVCDSVDALRAARGIANEG